MANRPVVVTRRQDQSTRPFQDPPIHTHIYIYTHIYIFCKVAVHCTPATSTECKFSFSFYLLVMCQSILAESAATTPVHELKHAPLIHHVQLVCKWLPEAQGGDVNTVQ